jgi:hypothetical protein
MARCEDYPCCGHGPPPLGDGGGCPNFDGTYNCVTCGRKLEKGARSSICDPCRKNPRAMGEMGGEDWGEED